jgi:hypothetical protein
MSSKPVPKPTPETQPFWDKARLVSFVIVHRASPVSDVPTSLVLGAGGMFSAAGAIALRAS